jgi:hypothetical protein
MKRYFFPWVYWNSYLPGTWSVGRREFDLRLTSDNL